jgi:subtilisin family serine protease
MKHVLKLICSLLLAVTAAFPQNQYKKLDVSKMVSGNIIHASEMNNKTSGLVKYILSKTQIGNGKIISVDEKLFGKDKLVQLYRSEKNEVMVQMLIRAISIQAASNIILAYGGVINTIAGDIIVAEIPLKVIPELTMKEEISFLEASSIKYPTINVSRTETKVDVVHNGTGLPQPYKGTNVVLGIIDSGIDWKHPDFKNTGGSRIQYLWDMSGSSNPPSGYNYGREYTKAQIDANQCFQVDGNDGGGHGTHVAGTSGGNGSALTGYIGMAPSSDIVFVKGFRNGPGFSDGDVVDGCNYIFNKSQNMNKPAVINLSLGGHFGPHDGTSNYEKALSNLTGPGKIIVAAAGNEGSDLIHLSYSVPSGSTYQDAYETIWQIPQSASSSLVDMWYNTGSISVGIAAYTKTGTLIGYTNPIAPGTKVENLLFTVSGTTYGRVTIDATATSNPNNNAKEVYFVIDDANGQYDLSLVDWSLYSFGTGTFDAWIASNGNFTTKSSPSYFKPGDNNKSVGSPSTSLKVICVGAYTTKKQWTSINGSTYNIPSAVIGQIASFSSLGPTRDGRLKPDLVAPGQIIAAALSSFVTNVGQEMILPGGKMQMEQGTSMACPHVAGVVALMLERNRTIDYNSAFTKLTTTTVKDGFTGTTAGNTYGNGKMNALNVINATTLSVEENSSLVNVFNLSQNYPNPFNPSTRIQFTIPSNVSFVTLKIFDVLGNEVAILVNEEKQPGIYEVEFNMSSDINNSELSSGVYFYKLQAGNFVDVKKMILMR